MRKGEASGDAGVTAIEYALLASLVAVAIILAVIVLGDSVSGLFNDIQTHVTASTP